MLKASPTSTLLCAALASFACAPDTPPDTLVLENPAGSTSRFPGLTEAPDGAVWMNWIDESGDTPAVRTARFDGTAWDTPVRIAEGTTLFVNWADLPAVTEYRPGHLAAHWLERTAAAPYAYDVRITLSDDGGRTWSDPLTPHADATESEHGFVSHVATPNGVGFVWLDGRNTVGGHDHGHAGAMQLRYAEFAPDGRRVGEALLDQRVCDCCRTAAARLPDRLLVAYRDRSLSEIRDIAMTVQRGGAWSAPFVPAPDTWRIDGCPVNGPAMDVRGSAVALAWYTAANDEPAIRLARSTDRANSFSETTLELAGVPLGRVDVAIVADGEIVVSWLEKHEYEAVLKLRRYDLHGRPGPELSVAKLLSDRAGSFPRIARTGNRLLVAWTDTSNIEPRVRTALVPLSGLARN